ncbi:MAG: hypothetical protein J6A58_13590 [Oscillospiraceae bacterium]|nr:hypothetical protein [Oscillospiraceae bacterium]
MKKAVFCFLSFIYILLFTSCENNKNNDNLGEVSLKQTLLESGKYYLNNEISDDVAQICVDEKNMLTFLNMDYELIVNSFKTEFPEIAFQDDVTERMTKPYSYTQTSREGEVDVRLFENCPFAVVLSYNDEDKIITFLGEDYYRENYEND